jgi:hypothetical protein
MATHDMTRIWTGLLASGALLFGTACDKTKDTGAVTSTTASGTSTTPAAEVAEAHGTAWVRVVNADPSLKTAVVYAGDSTAFTGVAYKQTTDFKEMPDDAFDFKVAAPGQTPDSAMGDKHEKLGTGSHYTLIAFADEGSPGAKANVRVLNDDLQPMTNGKARIRFINTAANAGELDLLARGQKDAIFEGVNFRNEAGWKDVDPMTGTLIVRPQHKTSVVATIPNVKLEAGKSYTYIVTGKPGALSVIKFTDDVAPASGDAGATHNMDRMRMGRDTVKK